MNQNEQMLQEALQAIANMPEHDQDDAHRLRYIAKQALSATVKESLTTEPAPTLTLNAGPVGHKWTPEDQRQLEAVMRGIYKIPEPAPLVRLTGSELLEAYMKGREHHGSNVREAIHISGLKYVQDAVIAKNGGKV